MSKHKQNARAGANMNDALCVGPGDVPSEGPKPSDQWEPIDLGEVLEDKIIDSLFREKMS